METLTSNYTPPLRVFLWSVPRSVSTAFLKSVSKVSGVQIINELYATAYWYGPQKKVGFSPRQSEYTTLCMEGALQKDIPLSPFVIDDSTCTFELAKEISERDFPEKQFVFNKDHAVYLDGDFTRLPRGYQHTFLIRHPHRVYASWKKVNERILKRKVGFDVLDVDLKSQMRSLFELMEYVENEGRYPVVVDADDLLTNPESILRQYCQATGIPFTDRMLEWENGDKFFSTTVHTKYKILDCKMDGGHSEEVSNSTRFVPPLPLLSRQDVPPDMLPLVDASMPYYEKMYAKRIKR